MGKLHRLTCTWIGLGTMIFVACAKSERNAADTSAMAAGAGASTSAAAPAVAPAAAAPISLGDVSGKWNMRSVPTSGDTTATTYVLTATGTTNGWTITFPGRAPMAVKVSTAGDSIMMTAGPYPSVRRKGQQVTTNGVMRMQNGSLVGTTVAHYRVKTGDSVLTLHTEGSRAK